MAQTNPKETSRTERRREENMGGESEPRRTAVIHLDNPWRLAGGAAKLFPCLKGLCWRQKNPAGEGGVFEEKRNRDQFRERRSPPVSTPRSCTGAGESVASFPEARISAVDVASVEGELAG